MSVEEVESRMKRLRARSRLRLIVGTAIAVIIFSQFLPMIARSRNAFTVVGLGLQLAGVALLLFTQFRSFKNNRVQTRSDAAESSVEFYRSALLAQQRSYRRIVPVLLMLVGMLIFFFPVVLRFFSDPSIAPRFGAFVPFLVILLLWGVMFIYIRRRGLRWLRREIEAVDAFKEDR